MPPTPSRSGRSPSPRPRPSRLLSTLSIALPLLVLCPATAFAAGPTAADKETARALLIEGRAKMEAKDFQGALKPLRAAHDIMHVPTTGMDYAAALEATGQFVEARVIALEVNRFPQTPGEPEAFADARVKAAGIAERLEKRIATIVVTLKGLPPDAEFEWTLDGEAIPPAAIGLPRKANPGTRTIVVKAPGFLTVEKKVTLAEAQTVPIEITLVPDGHPPLKKVGPGTGPGGQPVDDPSQYKVPTWAWVSGGVGVVALGVGAYFLADYVSVSGKVGSDCPNNICPKTIPNGSEQSNLDTWNRDVGAAIGLGAVGVTAVTIGIVGIARTKHAPKQPPKTGSVHVDFAPWMGPGLGGGALTGTF